MKYEEMVVFLIDHSLEDLSLKVGVPCSTLNKFLRGRGFSPYLAKQKERRSRINPLEVLGEESVFTGEEILNEYQRAVVIGSLFGDMYAGWTSPGKAFLRCEHAWGQIGYLKALYEILRPFSFSPYIDKPQKGLQDWQVGFSCHTSAQFAPFREAFYTINNGTGHLQKDIFGVVDLLSPLSLAVWIMDDGKSHGSAFGIVIGKGLYYTRSRVDQMTSRLNERLGCDLRISDERNAFILYVTKGSRTIDMVRDFVLPDFSYKLNIMPEACGHFYRDLDWYRQWQETRSDLVHPHLEDNPYSRKFFAALPDREKIRYERALFSQVRARGFPFHSMDRRDLGVSFERMKKAEVTVDGDTLVYDHSYNHIPNSFMNQRLTLRVKGHLSPYEVFLKSRLLRETLRRQLYDGPALNNSNIRAALSVYRTQAVGQYNPLYAKFFCESYCFPGGVVLDPCAGFGSRMTGCAASGRSYIGVEPSTKTVQALGKLARWLAPRSSGFLFVVQGCSEDLPVKSFDMAITSPPYFDKEEYAYEKTQSFIRFPTYPAWVAGFLQPLLSRVFSALRPGGVFVLNIDEVDGRTLCGDALRLSTDVGFKHETTFWSACLRRPSSPPSREPHYVLRRPLSTTHG